MRKALLPPSKLLRLNALGGEILAKEFDVAAIFFTAGAAIHAPEQFGVGEGYRHAVDFVNDETLRGFKSMPAAFAMRFTRISSATRTTVYFSTSPASSSCMQRPEAW